jgi:hypothetical protein
VIRGTWRGRELGFFVDWACSDLSDTTTVAESLKFLGNERIYMKQVHSAAIVAK